MSKLDYKSAGVDLDLYEQSMARLPDLLARTRRPGVMDLPGGFAGLFRLAEAGRYEDPVLVSGTDGVGTKLKVAFAAHKYDTVGIDLVAMCVNDCLCLGAEPLFFLDYVALDRDDPDRLAALVAGVAEGCRQAGCALLGGETAIMPSVYAKDEFDMAGFCVGVAERSRLIDGKAIRPGDVLLGLPSSGFHSNGYSLIRKVVFEHAGLRIGDRVEELGQTVGEVLLEPTTIYARPIVSLLRAVPDAVHGMAHITGGGLAENLERILPENARAVLRRGWPEPPVFAWLKRLGDLDEAEMDRVFNRGVGFVLVVERGRETAVVEGLRGEGVEPFALGEVVAGDRGVELITQGVGDWSRLFQYPDEWFALGFLDESFVLEQAAEYEQSGDHDIEHYKWAAYRRQIERVVFSDRSSFDKFIAAVEADPNPHLFKGAITELVNRDVPRDWFLSDPNARFLKSADIRAKLGLGPTEDP